MTIRQSYSIEHGGRYELGQLIERIRSIRVVSVTVNGQLIQYVPKMTMIESGAPGRYYLEIRHTDEPTCSGMLMVNKDESLVETFLSSDRFYDAVVVTLDIS